MRICDYGVGPISYSLYLYIQIDRVRNEYARLEIELEKHGSRGRIEMENFLDKQAEPAHDEIKRKLKTYDEKTTSYHQVSFLGTKCTELFLITRSLSHILALTHTRSLTLSHVQHTSHRQI